MKVDAATSSYDVQRGRGSADATLPRKNGPPVRLLFPSERRLAVSSEYRGCIHFVLLVGQPLRSQNGDGHSQIHYLDSMGVLTPSPTINYNFVAGVYAFFTALCALLSVLHFYTAQLEGFYIVLVPFVPCFFWSLMVRHRWLQQPKADDDADESKKDK
uniref:Uncharacterized protein n=1 Tax=Phytophthora fragariae TaxID=53985 RepID=A0A6A3FME2_9STRA|nr:hypothetical protein PF009_g3210 [Phytophthora fragariae]